MGLLPCSMFIPQMTSTITEKVNKLILNASSCGGKQATPPIPRILKDFAILGNAEIQNNMSYVKNVKVQGDSLFPKKWIQEKLPKPGELINPVIIKRQAFNAFPSFMQTGSCNLIGDYKGASLSNSWSLLCQFLILYCLQKEFQVPG
jgi:hypothetical protein